ncbi:MAG: MarR family transcriptional regulator [Cyclobacteriaceae bacterium]
MTPDELHNSAYQSIIPWLGKTMKHIDIMMKGILQESDLDLTKNQILVMRFIDRGITSQSDLSVITERDKSSLTRLIQSLEKKRFVTRQHHAHDKRQHLITLTDSGHEMLRRAMPVLESSFEKLETGIDKKQLAIARDVRIKILAYVETELEELNK